MPPPDPLLRGKNILLLSSHPSSINNDNLTTDISTGPTRQPYHRPLEVFRLAPSSGRNPFENLSRAGLILDQRLIHSRLDISRRDRIDIDPLACPLVAQSLGQLRDATLRARICRHCQSALETDQARHIDDRPSLRSHARQHVRTEVTTQREDAGQIDLQDVVPVALRELVRWVSSLDARAGD